MKKIYLITFFTLTVNFLIIAGCGNHSGTEPKQTVPEKEAGETVVYNEDEEIKNNIKEKEALIKKLIEQRRDENGKKIEKEDKKQLLAVIEPLEKDTDRFEYGIKSVSDNKKKELSPTKILTKDKMSILNTISADIARYKKMDIPPIRDERINELIPIIYFDFDDSKIKAEFRKPLQKSVRWLLAELEKRGNMILQIEGHADERGSAEYNVALGYRRANSVFEMIQVYSLNPEKIMKVVSFGEEFPAVKGSNEKAWRLNRRVQFTLLPK